MLMETGKIREIIFNRPKQLNTFVSEDIRRLDEIMEVIIVILVYSCVGTN